jgi:hypothetical protein
MKNRKRINLKPKPVFVILSVLLGIFIALLLPALYKILTKEYPEGFDFMSIIPDQFVIDGVLGALAGCAFAVFGLFRFKEALLIRLIRLFLLIIVSLTFLVYITIKSIL